MLDEEVVLIDIFSPPREDFLPAPAGAATEPERTVADLFRLDGKVALVTGASRGLGAAIAHALADAGADVVLHASATSAEATARRSRRPAAGAHALTADLEQDGAAATLAAQAIDGVRPHRHSGQQRRHDPAQLRRPIIRTRTGTRSSPSICPASSGSAASDRPAHAHRAAGRQDHQRRVAARVPGRHHRAGLCRRQGRRGAAHQGARERVGVRIASTSTRSRPATWKPTTPRRFARTRRASGRSPNGFRPADGASRKISPAPPSSWRSRASDYVHGHVLVVDGGWMGR